MKILRFFLLIFTFSTFLTSAQAQTPNQLDPTFAPVIENLRGSIYTITKQPDGKILAGGYFTVVNQTQKYVLTRFNTDGSLDTSFNSAIGAFGAVRSVVVQPDGKILVGGQIIAVSGSTFRYGIARINPDGSLDNSFTATVGNANTIFAVALQSDGKILIGGSFINLNGQFRNGSARLNADGTTDTSFINTIGGRITAIAIQPDGNILLGGNFTSTGQNVFTRIARVSPSGALDTTFNGNASASDIVNAIKIQSDGKLIIGGLFNTVNGASQKNIARLNSNGTLDSAFSPTIASNGITSIDGIDIDQNGKILIGGSFSSVNGASRGNVAKLNSDGTLDTTFTTQSGTNLPVRSVLAETGGSLLIGGDFRTFDGVTKYRFARLTANGSLDSSFTPAIYYNGQIYDVEIQPDGKIIAVGQFYYTNNETTKCIVRFNPDGTIDPTFSTASTELFADLIQDAAIQPDGKIVIAGIFGVGSSSNVAFVARLNADGSIDNSFTPVDGNAGTIPEKVKVQPDGKILLATVSIYINDVERKGLVRFNSNGSIDSSFNPTFNAISPPVVTDMVVKSDGKIVVGGYFSSVNSSNRTNLARLNSNGTTDDTFIGQASNAVHSLEQFSNGSLLVAGSFNTVNGVNVNKVAKLAPDGQLDTSFNADPNVSMPYNDIELSPDGRIILVGQGEYASDLTNYVVVLNYNGSTNAVLSNGQWFNDSVSSVKVSSDGKVIIGGLFTKVGNVQRFGLARFNSLNFNQTGKPIFDFDGDDKTDIGIFRPSTGAWWINASSTNVTNVFAFGNSTDRLVPADFTGDGKSDIAYFRPSTGQWFVLRSENFSFYGFQFGAVSDIPAPGDFDGDGKADPAVFRPSTASWYILRSSDNAVTSLQFGTSQDQPVVADYDGDGKDDVAVTRINNGNREWWILKSGGGTFAVQFGQPEDKTVQGDYTGDGKADVAFWRPSNGTWYIIRSENFSFYGFPFGTSGDTPSPGDYDGDGKVDAAVFRPSNSSWYLQRSTAGFIALGFGTTGDQPIPNSFVR